MVHRLRNWKLMIDIMRIDQDMMVEMINSAFEMAKLPYPDNDMLKHMVDKCRWATSQDGLEMCLTIKKEYLLTAWIGKTDELPEFEEFLKQLDSLLDDVGLIVGQKHQLYVPSIKI